MGPPRLLIIDDLPELCELLRDAFAEAGFEVVTVCDAADGRRLLGSDGFDAALIDAVLPGESGRSLADYASSRGLQVVLMSGHAGLFDEGEALPWPCLAKPFRLGAAVALVRSLVAGARN